MTTRAAAASAPRAGRRPADATVLAAVAAATAAVYAAGRIGASRILAAASGAAFDPQSELLAATLVGGTLTILATRLTATTIERARALWLLAFASVAAVMIEGAAFAPAASPLYRLPVGLLLQAGVALAAAAAAAIPTPRAMGPAPFRRGPTSASTARALLGAALVYVVAYFVTGALNYALVTGPYYAAHAGGLRTPPLPTVLAVALGEGLLLAAGALPAAAALAGSRASRALACGLALWTLGGVVPLVQATTLPDVVRVASVVEILAQKVPLGIALVWLLDRAARAQGGRS